jgi:hypothetical protein
LNIGVSWLDGEEKPGGLEAEDEEGATMWSTRRASSEAAAPPSGVIEMRVGARPSPLDTSRTGGQLPLDDGE